MSTEETAWQAGESAASVLGPEADLLASADAAGLGASTLAVLRRAARKPGATGTAALRYWASLALAGPAATARSLGVDAPPPVPVPEGDKRFADPAWTANPAFFAFRQAHLAASRLVADVLAAGAGDPVDDAKAALAAGFLLDAAAPTNFLATNPAALKRALETGGASVVTGAGHMVDDLVNNGGRPHQVDTRPFTLGENLAATPGRVVFRNDLMELIQYAPQTKQVRAVPVLASPPWINKYYVMDLAPDRSFLEWAVRHERTVFAISYRNPDASMRGITLDDYLIHGPREALDVIGEITGAPKIDIIGLCLGGTLTAMLAAYLAEKGDHRIGSITLLNTLLDYSEPGVLGAFTDEKTVARLEKKMAAKGVLEGSQMAGHLRPAPRQRPDLQLRGLELADGPGPARLRHPGLERRQHPDARRDALVLPAVPVHAQRAGQGRAGAGRPAAVAVRGEERHLRGGGDQRPHRALAWVVQDRRAARRRGPLRAVQRRPHRRDRQPARPQGLVRGGRLRRGQPGSLARRDQ